MISPMYLGLLLEQACGYVEVPIVDSEELLDPWFVAELWSELLYCDQPPLNNSDYSITEPLFIESLDDLYKHLDIVANVIEVRGDLADRPIRDATKRTEAGIVHLYGNNLINTDGIAKQGKRLANRFKRILRAIDQLSEADRELYLPYAKRICMPILMEGLVVADMMLKRKGL